MVLATLKTHFVRVLGSTGQAVSFDYGSLTPSCAHSCIWVIVTSHKYCRSWVRITNTYRSYKLVTKDLLWPSLTLSENSQGRGHNYLVKSFASFLTRFSNFFIARASSRSVPKLELSPPPDLVLSLIPPSQALVSMYRKQRRASGIPTSQELRPRKNMKSTRTERAFGYPK